MLSKIHVIIFLGFIAYATAQTYTQLKFSDCGSKNVHVNRISITPMPIIQPGPGSISLSISASETIKGVIKADVKIDRTVSKIKLPVKCYIIEGEPVGSCAYPDLCALMKRIITYEPGECPVNLLVHGINCECPLNIITKDLDIDMDVDIPKAPEAVSWISVGDFDVVLKATVGKIEACFNIGFSVKPKPK